MKKLFTALILLFSTGALACPEISGTFSCNIDGENAIWDFSQTKNKDGHTVFSDGTDNYVMDGASHELDWGFFIGTYEGSCEHDNMKLRLKGDVYLDDSEKWGVVTDTNTYKLKSEDVLEVENVHTSKLEGSDTTDTETAIWKCRRN